MCDMLHRGSSRGTMTMRRRAVGKTPATTGIKKEEGQGELPPGKMPTAPPAGNPALSPRQYDSLFNPARLHCQAEASKLCCVLWSRSREAGLARHQRITMSSVDCAIRLTEATLEVRVLGTEAAPGEANLTVYWASQTGRSEKTHRQGCHIQSQQDAPGC